MEVREISGGSKPLFASDGLDGYPDALLGVSPAAVGAAVDVGVGAVLV